MADQKLSEKQAKERLQHLDGWAVEDGCLVKQFKFKDFMAAMQFMNALVPVAEKLGHHPDWSNSYNKVLVRLTTHSEDGLTPKDFTFAMAADKASADLSI